MKFGESFVFKLIMTVKEEALDLINTLNEDVSWDDIIYNIYVKQQVQQGVDNYKSGKIVSHDDVKSKLLNNAINMD